MESRRKACLIFGGVVGAFLVALVAYYGYISTDDTKAAVIVSVLFASLAFGALFGHGLCVLVWKRSRGWAVVGILTLGAAAIVNISNSLDAVIGRSAKTYSMLAVAKATRANQEAEQKRLENRRTKIETQGYTTTSDEQAQAAKDAVAAAEKASKAECGEGGFHRGKECKRLESVEAGKRTEQAKVLANRALTVEIATIGTRLDALAIELAKPVGTTDANTAQQGGAVALVRLFRLPTTWADFLADWKMLALATLLDLLVILAFVFYEVLGWPTREDRKQAKEAAKAPAPKPERQAPVIDITPEPERGPAQVPTVPARVPMRSRPKLASTTKQPRGPVLDFLHEGLEIVDGPTRTEMPDACIGYVAWCKAKSLRPVSPDEFFNEMTNLCLQFGIPIQEEAGCTYLANVRLVPQMATLEHFPV